MLSSNANSKYDKCIKNRNHFSGKYFFSKPKNIRSNVGWNSKYVNRHLLMKWKHQRLHSNPDFYSGAFVYSKE